MDFLKGICILSVIVGHSITNVSGLTVLYNIIYSFHMPLLIFISAYIEEQSRNRHETHISYFVRKRAKSLLVPYITWNLLYNINFNSAYPINYRSLWNQLTGVIQTGLWFLAVLFGLKCMHAFYWYMQKKCPENNIFFNILLVLLSETVILILAVLTHEQYIINMISYAIPYFFGILYAEEAFIRKLCNKELTILISIVSYITIFQLFDFHKAEVSTQIIRIFLSLCVIVLCCKNQSDWQKNTFCKGQLCQLGRHSLEIYLLHGFFLDFAGSIQKVDSIYLAGTLSIILGISVACTCIFITEIISISKYARQILFGK